MSLTLQLHSLHWLFFSTNVLDDDVIKWKHFSRYWPFVRGIHWSPVNSPHKGQWRGALMFPLIYAWINGWINNREAGDLRHHRTHYDITAMCSTAMMHINLPRFLALSRQLFLYVWCIHFNLFSGCLHTYDRQFSCQLRCRHWCYRDCHNDRLHWRFWQQDWDDYCFRFSV